MLAIVVDMPGEVYSLKEGCTFSQHFGILSILVEGWNGGQSPSSAQLMPACLLASCCSNSNSSPSVSVC